MSGCEVLKTSRCAFSSQQTQYHTQIETGDMNQEPFEDVLATTEMNASHASSFVTVGKWAFQHHAAALQQLFAACATNPSSVRINGVAFHRLVDPISSPAFRL